MNTGLLYGPSWSDTNKWLIDWLKMMMMMMMMWCDDEAFRRILCHRKTSVTVHQFLHELLWNKKITNHCTIGNTSTTTKTNDVNKTTKVSTLKWETKVSATSSQQQITQHTPVMMSFYACTNQSPLNILFTIWTTLPELEQTSSDANLSLSISAQVH